MAGPVLTKRGLMAQSVLGSRQAPMVGSAAQVADSLQHWMRVADIDGFNVSRTIMPECLHAMVNLLVPVLQERGIYKTAYAPGTYREKLFGTESRLTAMHPARASTRH
jgi:alkanesulfonate monooxygenase SsuD/methylene tetrahydromethanopterin reductase-like flavin-dependent oxidoreductase (luciferase family)